MKLIVVFLGGGLGSICRYGISIVNLNYLKEFPLATLLSNVISCIVFSLILIYFHKNISGSIIGLLLLTGFCGGFSTFSTFSFETFELIKSGNFAFAFLNVILSLLICLGTLFLLLKNIK